MLNHGLTTAHCAIPWCMDSTLKDNSSLGLNLSNDERWTQYDVEAGRWSGNLKDAFGMRLIAWHGLCLPMKCFLTVYTFCLLSCVSVLLYLALSDNLSILLDGATEVQHNFKLRVNTGSSAMVMCRFSDYTGVRWQLALQSFSWAGWILKGFSTA